MRRKLIILICIIAILGFAGVAQAAEPVCQVDIGSFDVWKNSSGAWIPSDPPKYSKAYKPGDAVSILPFAVQGPENVVGVKSVRYAIEQDFVLAGRTDYNNYADNYSSVINNIDYKYCNNSVEVSYTANLQTAKRLEGEKITKPWQGKLVRGYRYYLPICIEWEIAEPQPIVEPTPVEPVQPTPVEPVRPTGNNVDLSVVLANYPQEATADTAVTGIAQVSLTGLQGASTIIKCAVNNQVLTEQTISVANTVNIPFEFKMPNTPVIIRVTVNPDQNSPPNETDWANNTATATVALATPIDIKDNPAGEDTYAVKISNVQLHPQKIGYTVSWDVTATWSHNCPGHCTRTCTKDGYSYCCRTDYHFGSVQQGEINSTIKALSATNYNFATKSNVTVNYNKTQSKSGNIGNTTAVFTSSLKQSFTAPVDQVKFIGLINKDHIATITANYMGATDTLQVKIPGTIVKSGVHITQ